LLLQQGKEREALEHFRAALARDARQSQSHLEVARILVRQGQDKEALMHLDAAEKYAPKNHNVRTVRGQLLIRLGSKEEGQAELAEAKKLFASAMAQEQEKMKERLVPNPELAEQP
jgi:predicted negative regulator of RcsB-dependent stress response